MASTEPSDDDLVRRSLAGEHAAFGHLVTRHQRLVYAVALSHARDLAQAEELAQQAFVEAWHELPRLRDPARLAAWLAGIARNVARSWRRQTARRRRRELAASPIVERTEPTPLDHVVERETAGLLQRALAEIPAAYREALVLFYVHGQSVAQVAAGLGIRDELAKQRLSRGRRALRAALETHLEDALVQLRPGKGVATTVMAAVGAAAARQASASTGKVLLAMKATKLVAMAVLLALVVGIAWHLRSTAQPAGEPAPASATAPPAAASGISPHGDASVERPTAHVRRLTTRDDYAPLVAAIRHARELRTTRVAPAATAIAGSSPAAGSGSADDGAADDPDQEYVRGAVMGLLPLIKDCYQQAHARRPDLAGKLVVHFTIEGEPDVGGVVTDSTIDVASSDIKDPELGNCVAQTMFALEIDPPVEGMKVDVTFPFTFPAHH